jgi:hypothetical protein
MEPATTIVGAVTGAHHAIGLIKEIAGTIKASGKTESVNALIDLQTVVLELMEKQMRYVDEIVQLRGRIRELESEKQRVQDLEFEGEVYWTGKGDGKQGPFCQKCFDGDQKMVRLRKGMNSGVKWYCSTCGDTVYSDSPPAGRAGRGW